MDTNVLLLLIVGSVDQEQVERFKRTRAYTVDDFLLLRMYVDQYSALATTPNVLSEVSNLAAQAKGRLRIAVMDELARVIGLAEEQYFRSGELVELPDFRARGLADASVAALAASGCGVVTDDLDLYLALAARGVDVVNFNHLRSGSW